MLLAMKVKVAITAAVLASPIALTMTPAPPADNIAETNFAEITATNFPYRVAGDFSRNGKQAEAPLRNDSLTGKLKIMSRQVPTAEYANCVDDGGCPRIAFSLTLRTARWSASAGTTPRPTRNG